MTCTPSPFPLAVLGEATRISPHRRGSPFADALGIPSSDGICGDAAHQGRHSDHNPDARGIPHAVDISQSMPGAPYWDPRCGRFDAHAYGDLIVRRMAAGLERRPTYLVSHNYVTGKAKVWSFEEPFWHDQDGDNHASHLHVSFTVAAEGSTAPFFAGGSAPTPAPSTGGNPMYANDQICGVYSDGQGHAWGVKPTGEVDTLRGDVFYGSYGTLQQKYPGKFPARSDFAHITERPDGKPGYTLWPLHYTKPEQAFDFPLA